MTRFRVMAALTILAVGAAAFGRTVKGSYTASLGTGTMP